MHSLVSLVCLELRLCTTMRTRKYQAQNDGRVTVASIISVAILNSSLTAGVYFRNLGMFAACERVDDVVGTADPE